MEIVLLVEGQVKLVNWSPSPKLPKPRKKKNKLEIIKPSEHGLGIVFVPDKRSHYMPADCKDQETSYPRWMVETWERLLSEHFKNDENPENALISRQLWFDDLPAVMRVWITTPNVLKVLRKRNPEIAKLTISFCGRY